MPCHGQLNRRKGSRKEEWVARTRAEGKEKFLTVKGLFKVKLGLFVMEVEDRDGEHNKAEWKARSIAAQTGQSILCFTQHNTTQYNVNPERIHNRMKEWISLNTFPLFLLIEWLWFSEWLLRLGYHIHFHSSSNSKMRDKMDDTTQHNTTNAINFPFLTKLKHPLCFFFIFFIQFTCNVSLHFLFSYLNITTNFLSYNGVIKKLIINFMLTF